MSCEQRHWVFLLVLLGSQHSDGLTVAPSSASSAQAMADISGLMRQHDPILVWAARLLPPRRAEAAYALYGWCRRLDEIVDDPTRSAELRRSDLDDWVERMDALWEGSPRDAMDGLLLDTLNEYPLGRTPFDEMVAGCRDDTSVTRYDNYHPQLSRYCYRVAGTVGEMLLPVIGVAPAEIGAARKPAVALGCAIQLTNIVRDVRPDIALGRIYLPRDDMQALGVSEEDVLSLRCTDAYRKLVRLQVLRAMSLLAEAEAALPALPRNSQVFVAVLIQLHREMLGELRRRRYDNLNGPRVRLPTWRKALVTVDVALRVLLDGQLRHSTK